MSETQDNTYNETRMKKHLQGQQNTSSLRETTNSTAYMLSISVLKEAVGSNRYLAILSQENFKTDNRHVLDSTVGHNENSIWNWRRFCLLQQRANAWGPGSEGLKVARVAWNQSIQNSLTEKSSSCHPNWKKKAKKNLTGSIKIKEREVPGKTGGEK